MIHDGIENAEQYFDPSHPRYKAIRIASVKAIEMPAGDHKINGDDLIAKVQSYKTQPPKERQFESHQKYIDVQVMLDGSERHDVATGKTLSPISDFDEVKDVIKLHPPAKFSSIHLEPGWFVVYYPQDKHRPNCCVDEPVDVCKVCMKVKI
ncbi:YhcH/YjgK/YiaL family protein [Poriferisphaera sp. WC338]|uniref:YhcH/YjgK/YiaL family protein n=1 Tax=Poriferisphaera sp. WC338 TaxID=3425129 RepID=UPI003D81BA6F